MSALQIDGKAETMDSADLLISGGTLVTLDTQSRVIGDGAIAIHDGFIAAIGDRREIASRFQAAKSIEADGALVLPGLINGHAHAAMSLFRGFADDHSLDDWLQKYIFPAEAQNVTEDFVEWGTRLSMVEMIRGGITTYADMYYFEDAVARATKEAGMRGILGETILDFPAPDHRTPAQALEYTQKFIDKWKHDPLVTPAVAPHSIYTLSEEYLQSAASMARQNGVPILIHLAEAPFEAAHSRSKHGLSPVAYLACIGVLGPDVIAAHCIWVDAADIAALSRLEVGCVHNPSSNMKLASGVMPVVEMIAAGNRIGLATDGAASNNRQDLFDEMDLAAKLQKISRMDSRALPAKQALEMATIGGARALHLEHLIGSLEEGKRADLILVDTTAPHATPMYNVYSQLVYALKGSDVRTVVIDGKIVMEDRRLLTLDEKEIVEKAREYRKRVTALHSIPVMSGRGTLL
jgi:5-methylthioadenosine/S-adenosylhomocysteine deaminase